MAHSDNPPLYISGKQMRDLVTMADVIGVVEKGLKAFSFGDVVQPVRSVVKVSEYNGLLGLMPSYCNSANTLATKIITLYPDNGDKGIPTHQAIVILQDPLTGSLLALLDGDSITTMRTAAASAVALKYMKPSNPGILCIVGTGVQARSHAEALQLICNFEEVRIWGRNPERASQCAADIGGHNVKVFQTACKDADVIVTVTIATEPILKGDWLKDGAVVIGVGACTSVWRELDDTLMKNALIVVDSKEAAAKEAGDIILANVEIHYEVGELVAKGPVTMETAHSLGKRFLVFKSLGIAIEDAVTGRLAYDKYMNVHT